MALFCAILGGVTLYRARIVLQLLTIISCWLTAKGVQLWTDDRESFWYTLLISLALPWGFVQSNRIWDPAFVPLYFSIVFYNVCRFFKLNLNRLAKSVCEFFLFGGLVLLAVVYPPCRIPAVAMWGYLFVRSVQLNKLEKLDIFFIFFLSTVLALPLAYHLFFVPDFNSRSADLLIFQGDNPVKEVLAFLENFFDFLSPTYLFVTGDIVDRHSLPRFGMLGMVNLIAAVTFLRKKYNHLEIFLLYTIFWTFFSAACTNDYQPHTLRSCLVWLPFSILLANGWKEFLKSRGKKFRFFFYTIWLIFFLIYFAYYIVYYRAQ